jgi:hypothetical protein
MATIPNKRTPKKKAPAKAVTKASATPEPEVSSSDTADFRSVLLKPGSATLVIGGFILFGVLLGATYAVWPILSPHLPPLAQVKDDPRVTGMEGRVQVLESLVQKQNRQNNEIKSLESQRSQFTEQLSYLMKRLEEQEKALAAVKQLAEATTLNSIGQDANESLERLSGRLADLEQGSESISKVLERIALLEQETERKNAAAAALPDSQSASGGTPFLSRKAVLAVLQVREALRSSAPFSEDLSQLKELATDQPEIKKSIAVLEPYMKTGIPTLAILKRKFESIAPSIIRANQGAIDSGWIDQTLDRLSSLVSIRKSGSNVKGNDVEAIIARAEENLKTADLPAALSVLGALPEKSREAAADWIRSAKIRLAAERAIASLHVLAVAFTAPSQRAVDAPPRAKE